MKYTNYILHGAPLHPEQLGIIALPAVIVGVPVLLWFLCGAIVMDGARYARLRYLLHEREQRRVQYIKCVLRSLDHAESRQMINLLKAA